MLQSLTLSKTVLYNINILLFKIIKQLFTSINMCVSNIANINSSVAFTGYQFNASR